MVCFSTSFSYSFANSNLETDGSNTIGNIVLRGVELKI